MPLFGPHVSREHAKGKRPSILAHIKAARQAAADASNFGVGAVQVFLAGPRSMKFTATSDELAELGAYLAANPEFVVIAHATYLDFPWNPAKPYAAKFIRLELDACSRAGIRGLVVHLGAPDHRATARMLPRLLWEPEGDAAVPLIYLEVPHVLPKNSHYETPEKLAALFGLVREVDPELRRFGLCIDTAHLWSCGVDLSSFALAAAWLARLESVRAVIPADRVIFHLNDSCLERGCGKDHHAPLLGGKIWGDYAERPRESGLWAFVGYALRHGIPTILEHKKQHLRSDYEVLERLSDVFKTQA